MTVKYPAAMVVLSFMTSLRREIRPTGPSLGWSGRSIVRLERFFNLT